MLEGVRFDADVELQTVLVPHLISLPLGFSSVRKELYRLADKGWYRFFDHFPLWPIYINGQGATSRKLEERYRRTTECGGPRRDTYDEEGIRALSINEATLVNHLPRWYAARAHEPDFGVWLASRKLLDPTRLGQPTDGPREVKPTLAQVMRDLSVLSAAARLLDEPIYILGDDAKDYFNQLAIAPEDWFKLGVVFLHADDELSRPGTNDRIFFVSERRLGFGARMSSNIAQRFSESILYMLREDMDAAEAEQARDMRPSAKHWRAVRRRLCGLPADGLKQCACERLYAAHMYTDDPIFISVGIQRTLRLIKCWVTLTNKMKLIMAIPEKRNLGTWAPWLGVLLCAGLGLVVVSRAKLLRTAQRLHTVLSSRCDFDEYRSLIGMLEHLRCVNCAAASVMYGLYGPHRSERVRRDGPSAQVMVNPFMAAQLQRWLRLLMHTGGAAFTAALRKLPNLACLRYVVSSDAATDSEPAGIGGYCHGLYYYLPIEPEWLDWLHITCLEMLATGGSVMTFHDYLQPAERVVLQSDSLATPYVLSTHKSGSEMLALTHHELLQEPNYRYIAQKASIAHLSGDCNPFSDAVSRGLWERFFELCKAVHVRPQRVDPHARLLPLIKRLVALAQLRGVPIRKTSYTRRDPVLPLSMRGLGRKTSACEEADAVVISARLQARLAASNTTPPAASTNVPVAAPTSTVRISSKLNHRLQLPAALPTMPSPAIQKTTRPTPSRPDARGERRSMATVVIEGARFVQLPPAARKESNLQKAAHLCASVRAADFASAGLASKHGVDALTRLLQHAADLNDYGSSHGTKQKNETAWSHWVSFAEYIGFDPVLSAAQIRDYPSEVATLLATFLLFIYPKMKGKGGRQWAKPRSAFSYVLAIIRIFKGWKLILPPAKVVKGELHGLLRSFVNMYGESVLMPSRREPMKIPMLKALVRLQRTALGGRIYDPASSLGIAFRAALAIGWRTGHRLAEFVAHPSGELCYLLRNHVSYVLSGVQVHDPTPAQLRAAKPGDVILIQPPRSKTDQFGEIHCPFPSTLPINADPDSAGAMIIAIELARPCRGSARETTPLLADDHGRPFTHSVMDLLLKQAITFLYGAKVAAVHSWHSMRIGLATALKAAKVDDGVIQMICRWTNPESLRAYARHGHALHIDCVDRAEHAIVNAVQSGSVPKVCNSEGCASLHMAFGGNLSKRARAVLDAADDDDDDDDDDGDAAADLSPLTPTNCLGRRVLVPRATWPNYACEEHGGRGWTARVVEYTRGAVTLHFLHATTPRGAPYEDVQLQLDSVAPL